MNIYADNLREFFNHDATDAAACEIENLEREIAKQGDILRRCKEVMACNDPTNYRLIFGNT
jgi:hypothetical protein